MRQNLRGQPTVLAGLEEGKSYTLQNRSDHIIYIETATSVPDASEKGDFELLPREFGVVEKAAEQEVYIWTAPQIDSGFVGYDEEA